MSARVRQAPGWWPGLVQAFCDDCQWRGPVRNLDGPGVPEVLVKLDARDHRCGEPTGEVDW